MAVRDTVVERVSICLRFIRFLLSSMVVYRLSCIANVLFDFQGDTYETDYHPADLHPAEADYSKEHKEQAREAAGEKEQEKPLTGAKHADSKQASHAEG